MKKMYGRLAVVLGSVVLLVGGVYAYKLYESKKYTMPEPTTGAMNNIVAPTDSQLEAQRIIDAATDKSQVPKAVWLAAGMTEKEYHVIWEDGTERPGTSPLNDEKRPGKYITKACGLEVFSSEHKYDSGTGWPSFYEANKENLVLKEDYSWLGIRRIEVESKCGEHLGHVFEDGPEPTGLRYCMNGAALVFVPDEEE